jgi:hypothetical protein
MSRAAFSMHALSAREVQSIVRHTGKKIWAHDQPATAPRGLGAPERPGVSQVLTTMNRRSISEGVSLLPGDVGSGGEPVWRAVNKLRGRLRWL